jgi:hypothetical protein
MFVGHLGLGFAAKRVAPSLNLGWTIAAVTALDLLWPVFVLNGVEDATIRPGATAYMPVVFDSYPWSHSLATSVIWGLILAGIARTLMPERPVSRLLIALVVSHWVLDVVSHAPDMPLWPGVSPHYGLGLWNSIPLTFLVEGAIWASGIAIFLRTAAPRTTGSRLAFWSLVIVSTVMWVMTPWSPPPPSARAFAWFGLIGWCTIPWAAAADRPAPAMIER